MIYTPFPYQDHATDHVIEHPAAGLLLEMGLGKTVATLTAVNRLIYEYLEVSRVLVIAPKRVAEDTWTTEAEKWDHLRHLRVSRVLGTERQRIEALRQKADIYVINRENVAWLVSHLAGAWPFDMVVVDESSSFKSPKSTRFKALRMVRPKISRMVILTGTPAPNSLLDLWPQLYLLDQGARLGKTITSYREKYFSPGRRNGHVVYDYVLEGQKDDGLLGAGIMEQEIYEKIGDICISMKTADYQQLPERIDRVVPVRFPSRVMEQYREFERKQVLALNELDTITAVNAASLSGKLLQFANGAVYDEDKTPHEMHQEKLQALEEIVEAANGQPVLVFYWFKHDLQRIKKHLAVYKPQELSKQEDIKRWNAGKTQLLLAHPASAGHGLNLQAGGNIIVWFGLPNWSLELYQQANARLHRLGQIHAVIIHHLIAMGTMDEDVMLSLQNKAAGQETLMQAIKARVKKYKNLELCA